MIVYGSKPYKEKTLICDLGEKHKLLFVEVRHLYDTGEVYTFDNGYQKIFDAKIMKDLRGNLYYQQIRIDYSNNVSYRREEDGAHFYPRVVVYDRDAIIVDDLGRKVK